jgi:hypothetical protein
MPTRFTKEQEQEIIAKYNEVKNVWKAGEALGIRGQTVHRVLKRNNIQRARQPLSDDKKHAIESFYKSGFLCGDGKLKAFAEKINVRVPDICRYASKLGLTNMRRTNDATLNERMGQRVKAQWQHGTHPRGMAGKKHTYKTCKRLSVVSKKRAIQQRKDGTMAIKVGKMLKTKAANGTLITPRNASWKQAWHEVGGKRFYARSSWEYEYAKILEFRKRIGAIKEWEHEPETFWFEKIKRGCRSYTPDFRVTHLNGDIEYHEIKGWMDDRSKTKIKRMAIYHKNVKLVVIDSKTYKRIVAKGI